MTTDFFIYIISALGRCLAATCLLGSYLGLLQHGRAVTSDAVQGLQNWDYCSLTGELLQLRRSRGSEVGTVAVSQKAGAPQAVIPPCQGTVFELLQPKCQGTVLERTRRTAESNCLDCCTAASNSAWRFSLRLGGTIRKHAVAIEARLSLAS